MLAYANPGNYRKISESRYAGGAAGHGLLRFNKNTRKIRIECWPRGADLSRGDAGQYPGWPVTVDQMDNYGKEAVAYLPKLNIVGMENPVFQVIDETTGDVVYTVRILGTVFQPKVFAEGNYTIIVGDQDARTRTLESVKAARNNVKEITVKF